MSEPTPHNDHPGLYRPEFEHDSCGFGLIAQMDGVASHHIVRSAIRALTRMTHRGAVAADGKSGDGCGLLMSKPDRFLRAVTDEAGIDLAASYGIGVLFHGSGADVAAARADVEAALVAQQLVVAGWRVVPLDTSACGEEALTTLPTIEQVFVNAPEELDGDAFERALFVARRQAEMARGGAGNHFYVASMSARVVSYKGLVMPANLPVFYPDLNDERLEAKVCVFHQRFSTNTLPQWRLAQPFRYLAHNGEINTIQGNRNWSLARGYKFESPLLDMAAVRPLVDMTSSDSYSLDNMLEGMLAGGMDIFRAMRLLIPPAWQNVDLMDPDVRAFHEFYSMHMEPWDGPAGIVLTDGRHAACILDRNGLRPARFVITRDRVITLASEIGVYDYDPADVVVNGRLKPGQMIAADTETGEVIYPKEISERLSQRQPYKKWLSAHARMLKPAYTEQRPVLEPLDKKVLRSFEKQYQVSFEERDQVLRVLAQTGQEAIGSMGDDTPLPVLSGRVRSLYDSFRQQFAQVTNPPIDPLREQIVMSLETIFGSEKNLFEETEAHAKRLVVESPVLAEARFQALLDVSDPDYAHERIDLTYPLDGTLRAALDAICEQAVGAVHAGKVVLVLSDRNISAERLPVHALLATGAVHHRLVREGLRCDANLVVETATARDPHHFAVLIGYGATAVHPYLAYEVIQDLVDTGEIANSDLAKLARQYRKGINKGLYKILSKMGISTITSYRGAQLFEAVGVHRDVVDLCFTGTTCRLQGIGFADLEADSRMMAARAWNVRKPVEAGGLLKYVHDTEYHAYNPDVVGTLQKAVRSGDQADYRVYAELVNNRPACSLRDLLTLVGNRQPLSVDEVEPVEVIYKRFDTAAMSLGALSPEAHEALAIAMNRLGGRSNSGEGGEDIVRYGTEKSSKIKQVASGRFGVTPHYLVNAEVLQIKVAQGAKPGEGGQLPGHKVNDMIARLRYARPGVALISPPPHHDIYSIEDLAQLIYDLKQVNPEALVSVKLVAEAGVGTIAAGVAKAYADLITIAGYDGGTGASPLTSVKYAGSPWELGLSETHQVLRANNLRDKVRLQTDGGLKTGLDVIKAAILGAESFGFGTGPMVALGCKYLRICHLNNCATGVATQNNVLRQHHFIGLPEMVMNYFRFIANEVRELLAGLGYRSLDEVIGRTELLQALPGGTDKQQHLDLAPILSKGSAPESSPHLCGTPGNAPFDEGKLAEQMVATMLPAIEAKSGGEFEFEIRNYNRSIGARISGEIARRWGNHGMAEAPLNVRLRGHAGQSFGVWNAGGLNLHLEGDANDYVGKGMAGGQIVVRPAPEATFDSRDNVIIGNTCLYGATGGTLYAAGQGGERFAVRNSGAHAVVEGVGDHGCEYMTGGVVVVLGDTGLNFGAGMTGGFAYVLDQRNRFVDFYNHELIDIYRIRTESMEEHRNYLEAMIEAYVAETGSAWGREVLDNFADMIGKFWLVKPKATSLEELVDSLSLAA